jgi:hypothetical protein
MEVMGAWQQHYDRAAYIEPEGLGRPIIARPGARDAERPRLELPALGGDMNLVRDLIEGRWDDERFLVVAPGDVLAPSYEQRRHPGGSRRLRVA